MCLPLTRFDEVLSVFNRLSIVPGQQAGHESAADRRKAHAHNRTNMRARAATQRRSDVCDRRPFNVSTTHNPPPFQKHRRAED